MRNIIFIALMTLMVWAMMIGCMSCQRKTVPKQYELATDNRWVDSDSGRVFEDGLVISAIIGWDSTTSFWYGGVGGSTVFKLKDSLFIYPGWGTPTLATQFNCIPEGQEYDEVINVNGELWKIRAFRVYFDSTENCYIEKE